MEIGDWVGVGATVAIGLAGVLIPLMLRLGTIQRENAEAHRTIGENIKTTAAGLEQRSDARFTEVDRRFDRLDRQVADINDRSRRRLRAMIDAEL